MGDVSDAVLNGVLCPRCGAWTGKKEVGYPVFCVDCLEEREEKALRERFLKEVKGE